MTLPVTLHQLQVEVWGKDRTSNMAFVHYAKLKAPANERFQRWCKVGTRGEPICNPDTAPAPHNDTTRIH